MPEGIVKYGLRRRCCNAGLAGDVVKKLGEERIRFFSIDRSDRFAEGTDFEDAPTARTRRGDGWL